MVKDQDIVQAVKDRDSSALKKLLHRAGKSNKKLLGTTRKININFQDEDGMSALHQASLMGNLEMMQLLLESGIQSGLKDHKGMLALHYAAWQGKTEPVHSLLQWKSPVNEQSLDGSTPLHLACQHGHFDVVNLLLLHNAVPTMIKKDNKTPLDLACEFGRYRVVDLLLRSNMCAPLLLDSPSDMYNNDRTTPIHLAAKNGHIEIIRLLLQAGVNINRSTLRGTCLHEAALCGKIEVVRLLLDCGVDVNKANSYDQTALDIVTSYTTSRAAKDLKHLLKEASFAVQARAIKNYCNIYDPNTISFKEGDIIKVIEQREDAWKGVVISDGRMAKPGFFPPDHVVLIDNSSHLPNHIVQGKRVHMPNVPDLLNRSPGYHQHVGPGMDYPFPPPPPSLYSPKSAGREHYCGDQSAFPYPPSPYQSCSYSTENINGRIVNHVGEQVGEWSALSPCPGVNDMRNSSPVKGSPTNSNRNSAASSDSGRGYSTGHLEQNSQKPPHNYANVQINNQHRLSSQSYESGVSSRQSYHSNSSSSLGSLDRLEESGHLSQINVAELFNTGLPDHEVLRAWLRDLHFEDYYGLFLHAGYDMPTISHMTPQDLSAIGITKPGHRKRLKAEIVRLNIHDGIPDYKPNDLMEWLHLLGLEQYYSTLMQQGYDNIDFVTDITWEDLEEIGIQKLGHQKKIMLAIDRLKRIMSGCKRLSTMDTKRRSAEDMDHVTMANQRWSGEEYNQEMPSSPFKHKKSSSGDSLNTNGSGDHRYSQHSDRHSQHSERHSHHSDRHSQHSDSSLEFTSHSAGSHASYQPDVVAIQVKRQSSQSGSPKDMAGQPITYQSFQVPPSPRDKEERESTPTGDDLNMSCSPVHVAPMVPKAVIKPKPVAKIIAKTKRSSREDSPDIIDIEKHEIERNQDKGKNNNSTFFPGGSLKKKSLSHSDHIYDQPHLQNSPKSPTEFNVPNVSMSQSLPSGPVNPIFISTQQQGAPQQQQSPKSRKVPPPPPPKRTNSISSRQDVNSSQFAGSIPKSALQHTYTNIQKTPTQSHVSSVTAQKVTPNTKNGNTPKNVQNQSQIDQTIAPKQQAFATCVQSLSERFGSKRAEVAGEDNLSSDGEDFPPPPPPIAMDIITPKIHNYGIPSKNDKDGSDYRIKAKMDNTGKVDSDGSSVEGTFGVKLRKTDACESVKTNNMSQSVPVKSSSASVSHNNSVVSIGNVPCTTAETTNSQNSHNNGAAKDSSVTVVTNGNQMVKRKDSTNSFDSTVSSSSVESNTLPFANENVGTIKQRTPTAKPSIVPINEGSSGCNNQESQNVGDNSGNFKANVPLNHVTGQQRAPKIGPKPVIAQKPGASPPVQNKKHNDNVLSDIDNMLQGLTEELDAMLEEELAVTAE